MTSAAAKRRDKNRNVSRDFYRAIIAGLLLIFVIGASFYDRTLLPSFAKKKDEPYSLGGDPSDNALRTGSMVIVPAKGNRCQHRTIDNQTWLIRDNGFVNCEELASRGVSETVTSTPRLDAIRDGFRKNAR